MELKYGIDDRPRLGQLLVYSLQWFVLAVAVIVTSIFIAQGSAAEKVLYAQKVFAFMGVATILQIFIGHRMPIISGPASVLLVGIITAEDFYATYRGGYHDAYSLYAWPDY